MAVFVAEVVGVSTEPLSQLMLTSTTGLLESVPTWVHEAEVGVVADAGSGESELGPMMASKQNDQKVLLALTEYETVLEQWHPVEALVGPLSVAKVHASHAMSFHDRQSLALDLFQLYEKRVKTPASVLAKKMREKKTVC